MTSSSRPPSGPKPPARPATRAGAAAARASTKQRKKSRFRRFLRNLALTFLGLFLAGLAIVGWAYSQTTIPDPNDIARAETSIIYYADGKTELDRLSTVNRESVPLKEVPLHTQRAMLAAEDRDFYDNVGISVTGILRGAWNTLRGADAQSGSTITQQYVKNYFLNSDQTLNRKVKEILISVKVDREQSKDQVLENYFNTIFYGRNSYGIKTAAKAYFGKDVGQLTVAESAYLAAVINQPSQLDPLVGPKSKQRAIDRVNYVLDGMVEQGWLTKAERTATTFPKVIEYNPKPKGGADGYLVKVVTDELVERGIATESDINRGGLRIVTTIDKKVQEDAVKAVESNKPTQGRGAAVQVGMVAIKPGDGAILAMYGGADFAKRQLNNATQGHFQAGSTMKTFAVLAALEQGISTRTPFSSQTPYSPDGSGSTINNWDFTSHGMVSMPQMLAGSINTAFVRLNERVGPENTVKAAIAAGLPPKDGEGAARTIGLENNVGNVLGSAGARPIDMASAYATIAAEGVYTRPYIVRSTTSADGKIDYTVDVNASKKTAFSKDVAADATDALRAVVTSGTGTGAAALGRPAAGKTGTSTDSVSAWFVGYTPQVSISVGMEIPDAAGNPTSMNGIPSLASGALPVTVWTDVARAYLEGKEVAQFPARVGVGDRGVTSTASPEAPTTTTSTTTGPPTTSTGPTGSATTTDPGGDTGTTAPTGPAPAPDPTAVVTTTPGSNASRPTQQPGAPPTTAG